MTAKISNRNVKQCLNQQNRLWLQFLQFFCIQKRGTLELASQSQLGAGNASVAGAVRVAQHHLGAASRVIQIDESDVICGVFLADGGQRAVGVGREDDVRLPLDQKDDGERDHGNKEAGKERQQLLQAARFQEHSSGRRLPLAFRPGRVFRAGEVVLEGGRVGRSANCLRLQAGAVAPLASHPVVVEILLKKKKFN